MAIEFIAGHIEGANTHTTFPFPRPVRRRKDLHNTIIEQSTDDLFTLLGMDKPQEE